MKVTNKNGITVFEINDTLEIALGNNADFEYRSDVVQPNNWVKCPSLGNNGKCYIVWYYVEDINTELDTIDYEAPYHITDETGRIIYNIED